jgi:hypothetical protein
MAEVIGLVASVVQLAGAGLALSKTLYEYADGVATADRRIKDIANEVKLTSFVIQELGTIFEKDETANLISENAVWTANETIKECFAVFTELELKINKGKTGKMGRLMLPFRDNKIELLRSQIDKLKSTLELLMQVLIHAHQVSTDKYNREAEAKHREEIKQLLENKKQATKKYEESLRNLSISDGSTAVDDGERSLQDEHKARSSSDPFNAASVIGSTVNPETLATCVNHVRSLLADIETLQLALAKKIDGEDHSDHHQKAIGTYFVARSHLDSVLLGSSQTNVAGKQTLQSTSRTSINTSSMSAEKDSTSLGGHISIASSHERLRKELERDRERERALAEEKLKPESFGESVESILYEREKEARMLVEREVRLEREAQEIRDLKEMRADRERGDVTEGPIYRPAVGYHNLEFNPGSPHTVSFQHRSLSQAKLAKREARARGERLWQEELRRREEIGVSAGGEESYRQRSRPLLQSTHSARNRSRSSSSSYLVEERHLPTSSAVTYSMEGKAIQGIGTATSTAGISAVACRRRSRSRSPPPRISQDHRRYDSDSSGDASSIEKVGSKEERDRMNNQVEELRRRRKLKREKKGLEREWQEERNEMMRNRIIVENRGMYTSSFRILSC